MPYRCGDVVWADLDPSARHEQAKRRPLIVVSNNAFNRGCSLAMTIPITSTRTAYPLHIDVGQVPGDDDTRAIHGFAEIEQLKSLDLASRNAVKVGTVDEAGMEKILSLVLSCLITSDMTIVSGF